MVRRIVHIDEEKCIGCGLCAEACHEGAIGMVDGKARLLRDDYCDGLGDCLPACPAGAISFVEREAAAYDQAAVEQHLEEREAARSAPSRLTHWPVQLKLVPPNAPWLRGADLLIAADCTAYACGSFHEDYLRGRKLVVACPKLDGTDYSVKLADIFRENDLASVTILRMEVPCCGGLVQMARRALGSTGVDIPLDIITLTTTGMEKE